MTDKRRYQIRGDIRSMFVIDSEDLKIHEDRIEMGDELFIRINERFHSRFRKPVSVMENGALCFNVKWESEYYDLADFDGASSTIPFYCNFSGEYLIKGKEQLDFTFFDRFDIFVFEGINEYSYHIIRLINEAFPGKKAVLKDKYSGYFKDIEFETAPGYGDEHERCGHFLSGHALPEREGYYAIYSLMLSMTWCRVRHFNENAGIDKTVLVIDINDDVCGFGDIIKKANAYYDMALERGWIPLITLTGPCNYRDEPEEDCWLKFFEPVSPVRLSDLDKYKCWISVSENRPFDVVGSANPYVFEKLFIKPDFKMDLVINENTMRRISEKLPEELKSGSVLGVMIRTTDLALLTGTTTDADQYIRQVKKHLSFSGDRYTHIFLATEDGYVLDRFRQEFKEKLLFVDQHRVPVENRNDNVLVSRQLTAMYGSKYELGCDYLSVIYALTACEFVLYNIYAGACYLSSNLRSRIRDRSVFVYMDFPVMDDPLDRALRDLAGKENEKIIIYGAGENARALICFYYLNSSNALLCDKKAAGGEYEVCGIRVISPDRLKEIYGGETVVVSPFKGKEQIIEMLTDIGIPGDKIISSDFRIK